MKVWELHTSDIKMTSFCLPNEKEQDSFLQLVDMLDEQNSSIKNLWEPFVLLKKEQCIDPDVFDIYDSGVVIVSKKAAALIKTILKPESYELYPFLNDESEYFLLHILQYVDCLDKEFFKDTLENQLISDFEVLPFVSSKISDIPIFKVPEFPYTLFVTHVFKYLYDELNLKGIDFDDENVVFVD